MLYLVETDAAEISHLTPEQLTTLAEEAVIPSLEALTKLQSEKKILAGGCIAGQRAHAFIVEAASNEAVSELLHSLPLWAGHDWTVTPLESWEHHITFLRGMVDKVKAGAK